MRRRDRMALKSLERRLRDAKIEYEKEKVPKRLREQDVVAVYKIRPLLRLLVVSDGGILCHYEYFNEHSEDEIVKVVKKILEIEDA